MKELEPVFDDFIYSFCEKIGKTTKYWTYDVVNLLELDFAQLLQSHPPSTQPTYAYEFVDFEKEKSCLYHTVVGADHGGEKSRYLVRTNC